MKKIHQPTREELIVAFRSRTGGAKVLFSCAADRARVHLTQVAVENPKAPPMFCMLLRKRLGNGKLLDIRQDGLERVLYFDFSCVNELGDIVQLTLAMEIMGRYSNLILIDETGKVVDSMKRVDATMSSKRLVLPGLAYEMPPRDERLNFLQASPEQMLAVLSTKTGELSKALLQTFEGVSPVLVREWAYYTGKGQPCRAESPLQTTRKTGSAIPSGVPGRCWNRATRSIPSSAPVRGSPRTFRSCRCISTAR